MSLPFFDDFSTYSLPTNNPDIPVELQRWEDDNVFINCDFPIMPPTIGVATFDGLDRTGYPYSFDPDTEGPADTLTSIPLNLSSYSPTDNVYLTFQYQGGGRGNAPEAQDSLMLEFFAPIGGDDPWFKVWSVPGSAMQNFEQVFIPVDNPIFLEDGFKFRFVNKATITGNLDHWHLDYVLMNPNINPDEFDFFEVAFVECPNSLLLDYTAMPWTHFLTNPSQFMLTSQETTQQNLSASQADNVTSGFKVEYEGSIWNNLNQFSNINVAPNEVFTTEYAINSAPNNFVFDTTVNDTCATFDVSFYHDPIGILADDKIGVPNNDSLVFQQVFENYYAYDDGTAERAYALNTPGGRVALKYNVATTDSLLGMFIHFVPFQEDHSLENFLLRVWDNNNGVPGNEIGENFQFNSPTYYQNGYNIFRYYELDAPVEVSGVIYVGFVQDSNAELNVGLDKNTNANPSRLFYQLGIGGSWQSSTIQGSLMIRPVFKSGKSGVWNSVEDLDSDDQGLSIYPNPASTQLYVQTAGFNGGAEVQVFDLNGRMQMQTTLNNTGESIDISELPAGMYVLRLEDRQSGRLEVARFVKQAH